MATKKLLELAESTSPGDSDILMIEDTVATKRITFLNLFNKVKAKLALATVATSGKASDLSGLATVATSGKLADTTKDANNRTITDAERAKWNGYGTDITSLNSNLNEPKTRTIEGAYVNMQVTTFGKFVWVRIAGYPKTTMKQGQEYTLFRPTTNTPMYGIYRRININPTAGFVFQMSSVDAETSITPFGGDLTSTSGINVSECYIMK